MTLLVGITVALAALAVLGAIVIVAVGGGGELSTEHPDHPPLALPARRPVAGTDAALLHLPLGRQPGDRGHQQQLRAGQALGARGQQLEAGTARRQRSDDFLAAVDRSLYRAKVEGRNRVCRVEH